LILRHIPESDKTVLGEGLVEHVPAEAASSSIAIWNAVSSSMRWSQILTPLPLFSDLLFRSRRCQR